MSSKKLYLVDASGYIFRAYYAIRPLSNSKGLPTNALFGFTNMLLKLLKEQKPDLIGIVFDVARKTFRNEKYPDYKANRAEPPPDLIPQFPYFRKIVQALNLPVLELPNYEADDVIGTIAKNFEKKKWETVIVTGDKDMMQLVDDHILIFDSMKEKWIREPEVKERFGVGPKQVTDILGLAGDSSDNIPGVPGIGEKTATKLVLEHGSLEKVLKNVDKVKGKMGEKLREFSEQAKLCKELATIVTDVPLEYDLKDFQVQAPDREKLKTLFEELEFKKFLVEFQMMGSEEDPKEELSPETKIALYLLDPDGARDFHHLQHVYLQPGQKDPPLDLLKKEGLLNLYETIEMPLKAVLETIRKNGVLVDVKQLQKTSREYEEKLRQIEKKVHGLAGVEFNLNSPKQLAEILFEKLKLPVVRKTKTGYSTDMDVLTELSKKHEVPQLLLEHRSLSKLKSTYLDALPALVNSQTGRIHASFHQTVAATGRLSSSDPNLQNIPIRTEESKKIRQAFIADRDFILLSADYSQIELRILAHMSEDPVLIQAFKKDQDIHTATAARIFGVMEGLVTKEMRAIGKTVNFAVLYGQGAYSLSQQIGVKVAEAENYIRNYFSEYKGVTAFREKTLSEVRQTKIVRTLFGRLRRFPEIDHPNANIRAMSERTAFNTVFQGTAADLIKKAMIRIQKKIEEKFTKARMIIQVHDELVFEVPENQVEEFSKIVKHEMEGVAKLKVSLKVEIGIGKNWAEAH